MYGALDISVSGMIAQRTRLNVIQANIANANSLEDSEGNFAPYLRRAAMFKAGDPAAKTESGRDMGVHVAEIEINPDSLVSRYDPGNPYANSEGHVMVRWWNRSTRWRRRVLMRRTSWRRRPPRR